MRSRILVNWRAQHAKEFASTPKEGAIRAAIGERNRVMFALMLFCGIQARELNSIRLSALIMDGDEVAFRDEEQRGNGPLSPVLARMLHRYVEGSRIAILKGRFSEFLFPAPGGRAMRASSCARIARHLTAAFWHQVFESRQRVSRANSH